MHGKLLTTLLERLEAADYVGLAEVLKSIGETKDIGLLTRGEYLMILYDMLREEDESKLAEHREAFFGMTAAIEDLRTRFKDMEPPLNLYDEFSIESLAAGLKDQETADDREA